MRRLLGPFHVTGIFWYRLHAWGSAKLPPWLVGPVVWIFSGFFFLTLVRIRRAISGNLEPVLGACDLVERQRRILRTMREFAWCSSEFYQQLGRGSSYEVSIEGKSIWRRMLAADEGAILATAHVGHWDLGSMIPGGFSLRPVEIVREAEADPRARRFVESLFERAGGAGREAQTIHFVRPDQRDLGMRLLGSLRQGHLVALQADRPRAGSRTLEVTLFGRPFELPAGPASLARAAGVPIYPIFVFREGRMKARVVCRPPIRVAAGGSGREALEAAGRALAAEIEWAIRSHPHQWFCFRELWPEARRE